MKSNQILIFILAVLLIATACTEKTTEGNFIIPSGEPATALTIGWYVPVEALKQLVGPDFKPKIINDKNESEIMLRIIKGSQHMGEGISAGLLKMAMLVVPVEVPDSLRTSDGVLINKSFVCPVNIIEKSEWLGNKLDSLGFATYTGEIDLNVDQSDDKYMVEAKVKTVNGLIDITGMFEESGESNEFGVANFTPKSKSGHYYYGEEKLTRIGNGKGNLKLDGQNIISAMQLGNHPYFLKLDTDLVWDFDFVN